MRVPLLKRLEVRGFEVAAVGSEMSSAFDAAGIAYYRYALDRWINPAADLHALLDLVRLMKTGRPDLVHAFDTKPGILTALAARQVNGLRVVRTITGMGYLFSSRSLHAAMLRPIYRAFQRSASRTAAMTIFQNRDDQGYFLSRHMVGQDRSAMVSGSGIDVQAFLRQLPEAVQLARLRQELGTAGKTVVTMVARLVGHKGVLEFMRCARKVRSRNKDVAFLLVGPRETEGSQAIGPDVLEEFREDVLCLGARQDVPSILAASDVFVLPSYYREGVPRVLLEAGAVGLPLVTTDMPGCRDVVRHGWNGLLVRPRDVESLCGAVETIVGDLAAWRQRAERNKQHIERNFGIEMVADSYARIYRSVLAADSGDR